MVGVLKVWNGTAWVPTLPGDQDDDGWVINWVQTPASSNAFVDVIPGSAVKYRRIGMLVQIRFSLTSSGPYDMHASTTGNYANLPVWSGLPAVVCPTQSILVTTRIRDMNVQSALTSAGDFIITGGPPSPDAWPGSTVYDGGFSYFLG